MSESPDSETKIQRERKELVKAAALRSLIAFAELTDPRYQPSRVHEFLAEKLERCERGECKRLVISMPPRHGKSDLVSKKFTAWALTKNRRREIIQGGYSAELSEEFSSGTKDLVESPRYLGYFDRLVNPLKNRTKIWQTNEQGAYFATGIGGGGVGRGADFFIIDDPFKNREEANSPTHREKVWNWFQSTASTRLSPDGVMIVIATRWHPDDLIGRLTDPKKVRELQDAGQDDMVFEVMNLEAICENPDTDPLGRKAGEALWPERWTVDRLRRRELAVGRYEWAAQFQGRPAVAGGNLTDIRRIKIIDRDEVPSNIELRRAWDLALSKKATSDFSCGAYGGLDRETGIFYLVHMDRAKRHWLEQKATILNYAEREANGGRLGIEAVGSWKVAADELEEALRGRTIVKPYNPDKDKVARALPWLAKIDGGMFCMVRGTWNQAFLDELEQFPNGTHDDQIDAVTVLNEMAKDYCDLVLA